MSKFGRFRSTEWGSFMPAHSPITGKGPWYYRETEALVVTYLTDEDAALGILPEELELVEPAMAFSLIETNHKCSFGPYSEIYTAIFCKWQGELMAYCNAVYVTGEASLLVGREVYGFGKKLAHRIELVKHGTGHVEGVVEVTPGNKSVTIMALPTKREAADSVASLPLICLKVIPDAEGRQQPALAQLVSVLYVSKPHLGSDGAAEVYSGPAEVTYGFGSDANLPVKQVLSCQYSTCYADLPYGRILKTY